MHACVPVILQIVSNMCANINICTYVYTHSHILCFHVTTLYLCACAVIFAEFIFANYGFCASRFFAGGHCIYTCICILLSYCVGPHTWEVVSGKGTRGCAQTQHLCSIVEFQPHDFLALCTGHKRAAVLQPLRTRPLRLVLCGMIVVG